MKAEDVARYLREHPRFLVEHPEIMARLDWPQDVGDATSMLEFQIRRERRERERLARKVDQYHAQATANEALLKKLHDFYMALVPIQSISGLVETARASLGADFGIDYASIAVLDGALAHPRLPLLTGERAKPFADLVDSGQSVCGRLEDDRLSPLLAEQLGEIRSAALVPMGRPVFAVLALGSKADDKFYPGMGTLFLDMLGQMLAQCVLSASRHQPEPV